MDEVYKRRYYEEFQSETTLELVQIITGERVINDPEIDYRDIQEAARRVLDERN